MSTEEKRWIRAAYFAGALQVLCLLVTTLGGPNWSVGTIVCGALVIGCLGGAALALGRSDRKDENR